MHQLSKIEEELETKLKLSRKKIFIDQEFKQAAKQWQTQHCVLSM